MHVTGSWAVLEDMTADVILCLRSIGLDVCTNAASSIRTEEMRKHLLLWFGHAQSGRNVPLARRLVLLPESI